jgi:hypothetical protein
LLEVFVFSVLFGVSNIGIEWHLLLLLEIMLCFQLIFQKSILSLRVD